MVVSEMMKVATTIAPLALCLSTELHSLPPLPCSVQLHRARKVPEDGDAAVLLGGRDARQEPGGARLDGADAHQGQEVLQRLQEEAGGRHGHLLRRRVAHK